MQTLIDRQQLQKPRWPPNEQVQSNCSPLTFPIASGAVGGGSRFDLNRQQISGSLQPLRMPDSPAVFPAPDPYKPSSEPQASTLIAVITFGGGAQVVPLAEEALSGFLDSALLAMPKVAASFIGRVESLTADSANVLLINDQTGEHLESRCDAEMLRENGIAAGDEFRCEVVRCKGTTATRFSRLPPKTLSKERVEQIRASFKDRWTF